MSLVVVDASILVAFYVAEDPRRDSITARLGAGDALFAPAHLDAEVVSALRRLSQTNAAVRAAVPAALGHLARFPIRRMPLAPLLPRMWELRENLTTYDAAYVTLAERLDTALLTCDAKMSGASGPRCTFDVIS